MAQIIPMSSCMTNYLKATVENHLTMPAERDTVSIAISPTTMSVPVWIDLETYLI